MKNLPIQLVEFRERQDDFLAEGGGPDTLQSWITDNIDICRGHSYQVYEQMSSWLHIFDERELQQNNMPLLFEVDLHQKAEAKSYRKDVYAILNLRGKKNVLGMTARRKLLVKVDNRMALQQLSKRFDERAFSAANTRVLRAYASIESVDLFRPTIEESAAGQLLKIRLMDYGNEHFNQACELHLQRLCEEYGQPFKKLDYVDELRLYKTQLKSVEFLERLATLDGVYSVQKMPYMTLNVIGNQWEGEIPSKTPKVGVDYPVVGLLDSGIEEDLVSIGLWMDGDNQVPEEWDPKDVSKDHGTQVASILLYGDQLCGEIRTGTDPCKIRSCVVNTNPRFMMVPEDECIDLIKRAIARNEDVKIWSSSMGSRREASMSEFSDYAKVLDTLQQTYDILICKSAGNKRGAEDHITCGADSVLSLVVGATTYEVTQDGKKIENWSPVSRLGLAAGSIIKPDLANLGGDEANPINVVNEYERVVSVCGTSYAVPRISAAAAAIAHMLGDKYNPLLVKALLIHSASYPLGMAEDELEERIRRVGFGIPQSVDDIMHNDEDEITMIFPCHFQKGHEYQVAKFVYPEGLVEDGLFYGDITMTLVTNPILNFNQGAEYCQTDVEVKLYTYATEHYIDLGDVDTSRYYRNPLRLDGCINVLSEEKYSRKRCQEGTRMWECNRIDKLHKFSPIKKFHVNLDNMTDANKQKALGANRLWALRISALFREESENSIAREHLQFDAYLVMTIRDPKKRGIVYNQTINQLNECNFIHQSIEVRQDIEVRNAE